MMCQDSIRIPLLGSVAAGEPIEMFAVEETLEAPRSLWNGRHVFALRVRGKSMIEAGIHDGDYLIVEPCATADNGRTVVAEVDGQVTVKRLYRENDGRVRLQPANATMLPFIVRAERVKVRGAVVGILRKYGFKRKRAVRETAVAATPVSQASRPALVAVDKAVSAIDARLENWRRAAEDAQRSRMHRAGRMMAMGRDLQALRQWCVRTSKPQLQRALIAEADKLMQRMDELMPTEKEEGC